MKIKGDENMYTVNRHKFHKLYVCNETDEIPIGPFTRFEKEQLEKIVALLNEKNQFKKPLSIPDKEMNNLAYYCSMVYEMFLTVNWEYEKLGKGTTHHEVIRAGTETLAKEYYYNFKEILKLLVMILLRINFHHLFFFFFYYVTIRQYHYHNYYSCLR